MYYSLNIFQPLWDAVSKIFIAIANLERKLRQDLFKKSRSDRMSIICTHCGHENQIGSLYCDECGEELKTKTLSSVESVEEETIPSKEASAEVPSSEVASAEAEVDTALQSQAEPSFESALTETEESEQSTPPLPMGTATRLELDEPPIPKIVAPATTLELPTAVLINQETGEKFILPSEEKTVYIGRINEEFPVQVDLSAIPNADLISRVHAAIHLENEVYYLEDAGSANGTWLNDQLIQTGTRFRQKLNPGDTIAFGRHQTVKFTFNLEDS